MTRLWRCSRAQMSNDVKNGECIMRTDLRSFFPLRRIETISRYMFIYFHEWLVLIWRLRSRNLHFLLTHLPLWYIAFIFHSFGPDRNQPSQAVACGCNVENMNSGLKVELVFAGLMKFLIPQFLISWDVAGVRAGGVARPCGFAVTHGASKWFLKSRGRNV